MKRYTTDKPEGNVEGYRNFAFIKNKEVYLRGIDSGEDISLDAYCKKGCKEKCDIDYNDVPIGEFAEYMMDCDCPVSLLYTSALAAAELREKLSRYEDTGLEPEEIKAIIAIAEEQKPCSSIDTIEYHPIPVKEAERIANAYGKDIVVINAYEYKSNLIHTTTYGKTRADKHEAARCGELTAKVLGGDLTKAVTYEDFRGGGNEGCSTDQG